MSFNIRQRLTDWIGFLFYLLKSLFFKTKELSNTSVKTSETENAILIQFYRISKISNILFVEHTIVSSQNFLISV